MRCTTTACENTAFEASTTAYLDIDLSVEGEHTVEIEGIDSEEIELVCRECGNPVDDDKDSSFDRRSSS